MHCPMAVLINIGMHKRSIRIVNRGQPRKGGSHLNHDGFSALTQGLEELS